MSFFLFSWIIHPCISATHSSVVDYHDCVLWYMHSSPCCVLCRDQAQAVLGNVVEHSLSLSAPFDLPPLNFSRPVTLTAGGTQWWISGFFLSYRSVSKVILSLIVLHFSVCVRASFNSSNLPPQLVALWGSKFQQTHTHTNTLLRLLFYRPCAVM